MSRFVLVAVLITVAVAGPVLGAKKQRDWQTGTVVDTDRAKTYLTLDRAILERTVVIDAGRYIYVASQECGGGSGIVTTIRARCRPVILTVNTDHSFAVEKYMMYVIDDDGREIKAKIVKRILKTEPADRPKQ